MAATTETLTHKFQHADGPTWCVHCGKFSCYCTEGEPCGGEANSRDASNPEKYERMASDMFGCPAEEVVAAVEGVTKEQARAALDSWHQQHNS